jgi:hypothetical protein
LVEAADRSLQEGGREIAVEQDIGDDNLTPGRALTVK